MIYTLSVNPKHAMQSVIQLKGFYTKYSKQSLVYLWICTNTTRCTCFVSRKQRSMYTSLFTATNSL